MGTGEAACRGWNSIGERYFGRQQRRMKTIGKKTSRTKLVAPEHTLHRPPRGRPRARSRKFLRKTARVCIHAALQPAAGVPKPPALAAAAASASSAPSSGSSPAAPASSRSRAPGAAMRAATPGGSSPSATSRRPSALPTTARAAESEIFAARGLSHTPTRRVRARVSGV
eukprot:PRCOL_00006092-RA